MDKFKKLDCIAIVPATLTEADGKKRHGAAGGLILFDSTQVTFHNVATAEQSAEIEALIEQANATKPTERRRLATCFPEHRARLLGVPFLSARPANIRKTVGRPLDDNDDLAHLYKFIKDEASRGHTYPSNKQAVEAFANAGHVPAGQVRSLRNKMAKYGRAFELSRTIRIVRFGR